MSTGKNPCWLQEIRSYWKEVNRKLSDESGDPPRTMSGEAPVPSSAGKEVPARHPRDRRSADE